MKSTNIRGLTYLLASVGLAGACFLNYNSVNPGVYSQPAPIERNIKSDLENKTKDKISENKKRLILQREYSNGNNTKGELFEDINGNGILDNNDLYVTTTLEPPWKQNKANISCIPEGTYEVRPRSPSESRKFKTKHFLVKDVPNRTAILIHGVGRSEGCIMTPELAKLVENYGNGFELIIKSN